MKKGVVFIFITLLFLFAFPLVLADTNNTQINNGFSCLTTKIGSNCPSLPIGEKIFSSLATGQCTSQLESSESSNGCFPSGSCDIKTTSQALLALKNSGRPIDKPVSWLLSQKIPTSNIDWYLQIDPSAASSCTVSYSGNSPYTIDVNDDKTLSGAAGSCLSVSPNGYWLLVSPTSSCYGINFSISCDQPFKTTTLYQRQGYPTIYVSTSLNSASAGGTLKNSVDSSCFSTGSTCDYESSLWAAMALDSAGKDVSSFIPYLTVFADDEQNQQYIPYSFLYSLTSSSDFLNKLLAMQKTANGLNYWDQKSTNGQYYDTALALLPLQSTSSTQKTSAVNWLLSVQGTDGCWNSGNILDTAFILYSLSGSRATSPTTSCTTAGYYCISSSSCTQVGGNPLPSYSCPVPTSCCSQQIITPKCSDQSGVICSSGLICQGGSTQTASDTLSGQTCCVGGSCAAQPSASACELASKSCRDSSCLNGEQISGESCTLGSEVCCEPKTQGNGIVWIILLIVLIVLVLLGIVFRKKLRVLWLRIKSKFKKGPSSPAQAPPRGPPPFRPQPSMGFQRRPQMIPPHKVPPQQRPTEVNDVLKRLKEIGK